MKLSVLQWNVLYKERADNIVELIRNINADIVCTQELMRDSHLNPGRDIVAEISELGYQYRYESVITLDETPEAYGDMGNGIFSKYPILDGRVVYVQRKNPDSNSYDQQNRAYIEATIDTPSGKLQIGTAHLSYTDHFIITEQKKREADNLIMAAKPHTVRFVLTGDFNAPPDSYTINKLDELFVHAGPDFNEPTWTTKPFSYNGFEATTLNWRLDYVYTTPDIKVVKSEIISTNYSDHLPILTEIEL